MNKVIFTMTALSLWLCSTANAVILDYWNEWPGNEIHVDKHDRLYVITKSGIYRSEKDEKKWKYVSSFCNFNISKGDKPKEDCFIAKNHGFSVEYNGTPYRVILENNKDIVLSKTADGKTEYYLSNTNLDHIRYFGKIKPDIIRAGYAYAFKLEDGNKVIKMYRSKNKGDGWDELIIDKKNIYLNSHVYVTSAMGKIYLSVTESRSDSFPYSYVSEDLGNTWKKFILFDEIRNREDSLTTIEKGNTLYYEKNYLYKDNRYYDRLYYFNDVKNNNFRVTKEMPYFNLRNCCGSQSERFTINSKGIMYLVNDYGVCKSEDRGLTWKDLHFPRKYFSKDTVKGLSWEESHRPPKLPSKILSSHAQKTVVDEKVSESDSVCPK